MKLQQNSLSGEIFNNSVSLRQCSHSQSIINLSLKILCTIRVTTIKSKKILWLEPICISATNNKNIGLTVTRVANLGYMNDDLTFYNNFTTRLNVNFSYNKAFKRAPSSPSNSKLS